MRLTYTEKLQLRDELNFCRDTLHELAQLEEAAHKKYPAGAMLIAILADFADRRALTIARQKEIRKELTAGSLTAHVAGNPTELPAEGSDLVDARSGARYDIDRTVSVIEGD